MAERAVTDHELRAALRVARIVDLPGNSVDDVHASYRSAITRGEHTAEDLRSGEHLLLDVELIARVDDRLVPTPGLHVLATVQDDVALALLREVLHQSEQDELAEEHPDERAAVGAAGEEHVAAELREELSRLGRHDLVPSVQRVSLVSDRFGYDVSAPAIVGQMRKLEVKTETAPNRPYVRFFLSRHEFDTGRRSRESWALVACRYSAGDDQPVTTLGWCRAVALSPYLPDDRNGRWSEALVRLPTTALVTGLPPAL
jgi:hypothetical protein